MSGIPPRHMGNNNDDNTMQDNHHDTPKYYDVDDDDDDEDVIVIDDDDDEDVPPTGLAISSSSSQKLGLKFCEMWKMYKEKHNNAKIEPAMELFGMNPNVASLRKSAANLWRSIAHRGFTRQCALARCDIRQYLYVHQGDIYELHAGFIKEYGFRPEVSEEKTLQMFDSIYKGEFKKRPELLVYYLRMVVPEWLASQTPCEHLQDVAKKETAALAKYPMYGVIRRRGVARPAAAASYSRNEGGSTDTDETIAPTSPKPDDTVVHYNVEYTLIDRAAASAPVVRVEPLIDSHLYDTESDSHNYDTESDDDNNT